MPCRSRYSSVKEAIFGWNDAADDGDNQPYEGLCKLSPGNTYKPFIILDQRGRVGRRYFENYFHDLLRVVSISFICGFCMRFH